MSFGILIEGAIYICLAVLLMIFCMPIFLRGAPFFPLHKARIEDVFRMVDITINDRVVDIGSGDGRLVIASARRGAKTIGYEINPFLVWYSRIRIRQAGLRDYAEIRRANIWDVNFGECTAVLLFGFPYMMDRLEKKLRYELPKGARVVSFVFQFPTWAPTRAERGVYLYLNE